MDTEDGIPALPFWAEAQIRHWVGEPSVILANATTARSTLDPDFFAPFLPCAIQLNGTRTLNTEWLLTDLPSSGNTFISSGSNDVL
jgi:hypothetical protein